MLHLPTASSPFIHTFVAAILAGNRQPTTCCVLKYTGLQYCYVTSLLFFNHYWRTDFTTTNAKARAQLLVDGHSHVESMCSCQRFEALSVAVSLVNIGKNFGKLSIFFKNDHQ